MKGGYYIGGALPARLRLPIFVTSDRSAAEWYASERGDDGRVHPVSIRTRRPFHVNSINDIRKLAAMLKSAGIHHNLVQRPEWWSLEVPEVRRHSPYDGTNPLDVAYIPKVREMLVRNGYDSIAGMDQLESSEVPVVVLIESTSQLRFEDIHNPLRGKRSGEGEAKVNTDYDRLAEDLRDEVDSFAPARDTGRRDYDMDDVIDRFVTYASSRPGLGLDALARSFGRQDPASAGQLRKLRGALRGIALSERKNPMKTTNPARLMESRREALNSLWNRGFTPALRKGLYEMWYNPDTEDSVIVEVNTGKVHSKRSRQFDDLHDMVVSEGATTVQTRWWEGEGGYPAIRTNPAGRWPARRQRLAVCIDKSRRNPLVPDDTNKKAASMSV